MQISQKSKETIDACRFCWMCRHICPIGNATGQERNTARARALSLSLVTREGAELSEVTDNLYECALCGACTKECATAWDPVMFTKEARLSAALSGCMPEYIDKLLTKLEKTGNVYGKKTVDKKLAEEIAKLPKKADILLYFGQDTICNSPKSALFAIELLKKAKVKFTVLEKEPESGYAYDFLIGAADETKKAMTQAAKQLAFKKIIAFDPADAKALLREYKEWNVGLKAEVVTMISFVAGLIKDGKLKVKNSGKEYTFQDPAHLARDLEDCDSARVILSACGKNKEMLLYGKDTMLAGHSIMKEYMPDVMKLVAEKRMADALHVGATTLVTASSAEYEALKALKVKGIEIKTVEEVVLECL